MAKLEVAKNLAGWLLSELKPFCENIIIAGSIRRGKAEVKDIELVAIPKWVEARVPAKDMFSEAETVPVNLLHHWIVERGITPIRWIKPGTPEIIDWTPKPEGKYWRGLLTMDGEPIKLDLFLARPENFGVISFIRTGPADFNAALFAYLNQSGKFHVDKGQLWNEKIEIVPCATEEDFFAAIGIRFIPVEYRETWRDFKSLEGK